LKHECETTQLKKALHSDRPKSNSPSLLEQTSDPDAEFERETLVRRKLQQVMNTSFE
jgi:hypothetical protein